MGYSAISEAEIWLALKIVELDDSVKAPPGGLNFWLGETGGNVSWGQARRLSLARLLLCHPQLTILDEPFNGIEDKMAARIWHNMLPRVRTKMLALLTYERSDYLHNNVL